MNPRRGARVYAAEPSRAPDAGHPQWRGLRSDRHEDGRISGAEWGHILVALVLAAVLIWRMERLRTTQERDSPEA